MTNQNHRAAGVRALQAENQRLREAAANSRQQATEARAFAAGCRRRADEAEAEVIRLKAKLYDYITA